MGSPKNAAAAREALIAKKGELEEEKRIKELKSYTITVKVDPEFHPKIIGKWFFAVLNLVQTSEICIVNNLGKRGAVISEIRDKYDVNIQLPQRSDNSGDMDADVITISGFEDQANAARDKILSIVNEFVSSNSQHEIGWSYFPGRARSRCNISFTCRLTRSRKRWILTTVCTQESLVLVGRMFAKLCKTSK